MFQGLRRCRPSAGIDDDAIDVDGSGVVLERLFARILHLEGKLVARVIEHRLRNANAARLRERLEPRGDVHSLAIEVAAIDHHIAKVDPDTKLDALVLRYSHVALEHALLNLDRAAYGIHNTWKLDQNAIAHRLDDSAVM